MTHSFLRIAAPVFVALAMLGAPGWAQNGTQNDPVKYKTNLPPSADLAYSIKAKQSGLPIDGDAVVHWTVSPGKFEVSSETRAALFGKILDVKSVGAIDAYGLAPSSFTEKRFRKNAVTTSFDRASRTINFGNSTPGYSLKGGEQDRTSALWQLISMFRAAPAKVKPGSEWSFVVAGHSDAEPWSFKVVNQEKVRTQMGELNAVHIMRESPPDSKDQKLDIWLAPSLEWYPVRLRFTESDGDFIDQTLAKIKRKSS